MPAFPIAPDWTELHQRSWAQFLSSETGQAMWARLKAVEADVSARAVQDPMHTAHSAGRAAGFADCRTWLESLTRACRDSQAQQDAEQVEGEPEFSERLSP